MRSRSQLLLWCDRSLKPTIAQRITSDYHPTLGGIITEKFWLGRDTRSIEFNPNPMPAEAIFSELTFEQVIAQIFARRRISLLDQQLLSRALKPETPLTPEQDTAIETIFKALHSGWLKVVD